MAGPRSGAGDPLPGSSFSEYDCKRSPRMDLVLSGAVVTDEAGPPGLVLDGVLGQRH